MNESQTEIKRWTANRKTQVVLDILKGKTTVADVHSVRAYLLKEEFQLFWRYISLYWEGRFLYNWCSKNMRSKIGPMKKVVKMLRVHRALLLNWFRAEGQLSSGVVEGFNTKAKLTSRKAFGFRTFRGAEIDLYHVLGSLPETQFTRANA